MELKGTKTEKNLWEAFAGESQARNKYTYFASVAKKEGYKAIAITDHDTATAYPYLKAACEKENMECVFGVEFSVQEPGDFHIVGFNFDPEYPKMKKYLEDMAMRQTDNTKKCFVKGFWNFFYIFSKKFFDKAF